jgi:hypothetical protein
MTQGRNSDKKYGVFLFEVPPWKDHDSKVLIGPVKWVVMDFEARADGSIDVMVNWPKKPFSNYLKVSRELIIEDAWTVDAVLLFVSNGNRCYFYMLYYCDPILPNYFAKHILY